MSKSAIFGSCLVIIMALLGKFLVDFGVFRHIETKGLDQCRLIVPIDGEYQAFEDLAIDDEKGIAYMPGDNRAWWDAFALTDQIVNKQGVIFMFDIQSESFRKFDLIDYPYEHFHPLGVGLLKRQNNHLFTTNFRTDSQGKLVGTVEIFVIDSSAENRIKWIDSIVHPLFTVPDDVLPIDEKSFYVTNIYHYPKDQSPLMHTMEILATRSWTNILLCLKTDQWQCSIADDSIKMANGLAASLDFKTVYVAASGEKQIRIYDRNLKDNSLTYQESLSVPFFVDNVVVNEKDQLLAAGHPNGLAFLRHAKNPREYRAPSEVVIFPNPKSNSTFETPLLTNGELLSASTVAATYKGKLLVGAIFDHGILVCQNLSREN